MLQVQQPDVGAWATGPHYAGVFQASAPSSSAALGLLRPGRGRKAAAEMLVDESRPVLLRSRTALLAFGGTPMAGHPPPLRPYSFFSVPGPGSWPHRLFSARRLAKAARDSRSASNTGSDALVALSSVLGTWWRLIPDSYHSYRDNW